MRAETVARRLRSFPRVSVGKVRFEADQLGGRALILEVAVRGRPRCSRCGRKCPGYDRLKPRRWRHLDFGTYEVQLEATLCRVECGRCGVVVEQVNWADPESRFTLHFEELIGWLAQRCDKTAISTTLRVAWRTVGTILERVVARHRAPIDWTKVSAIATDELSFRKGQHDLTLVSDIETGRILWSKEGPLGRDLGSLLRRDRRRRLRSDPPRGDRHVRGLRTGDPPLLAQRHHRLRPLPCAAARVQGRR